MRFLPKVVDEGKEIFPNGDEYEGEFVNHVFEGHGVLKYNNGNIYDGEISENRMEGNGYMVWNDKCEKYVGKWENNLQNENILFIHTGGAGGLFATL